MYANNNDNNMNVDRIDKDPFSVEGATIDFMCLSSWLIWPASFASAASAVDVAVCSEIRKSVCMYICMYVIVVCT